MEMEILELADFEGQRPGGTRLKLNSFAPQRTSPLHEGDEIVVMVRAKVKKVAFSRDPKVGLLREHNCSIKEAYVVPDGEIHNAEEWLSDMRIAHKVAMDQLAGQTSIDDPPLSDEELAAEEARLAEQEAAAELNEAERVARDEDHVDPDEWMQPGYEPKAETDPEAIKKAAEADAASAEASTDEDGSEARQRARELAEKEGPAVTAPRAARRAKATSK